MSENNSDLIVTDTSALVCYFGNDKRRKKAVSWIDSNKVIVPSIVVAELSDFFHRNNQALVWERVRKPFLEINTTIYPLEVDLADRAGKIKTEKRKKNSGFSLADGIVIATAEHARAKILTADHYLSGKNTILLS